MKKLRSIGCLIVLILSVLNLKIALGQGEENLNNDQDVTLEVNGGFLTLMIPAEYQYQTVELTELERYPFSYTFMNEETGIRFTVYSTLHSQKDQSHFLKKLYDKSNRYIVFEDVLIGGYTYIVYTIEQATYAILILVLHGNCNCRIIPRSWAAYIRVSCVIKNRKSSFLHSDTHIIERRR